MDNCHNLELHSTEEKSAVEISFYVRGLGEIQIFRL